MVCASGEPHGQSAPGSEEVASVLHSVPTWEEEKSSDSRTASSHFAYPLFVPSPLFSPDPSYNNTFLAVGGVLVIPPCCK